MDMIGLLRIEDAEVDTEKHFSLMVEPFRHLTAMLFIPDGCPLII